VTCSLKRISIFLGWDKPKPTGVSGPETDPVASTTGDLDDYFIGLMEPMMKSLEREDGERVEAPWIKLDHCPPGEEVVQEKRTEFGFVGNMPDKRGPSDGKGKRGMVEINESRQESEMWRIPKGCLELMGGCLRGALVGTVYDDWVKTVRSKFPECPEGACREVYFGYFCRKAVQIEPVRCVTPLPPPPSPPPVRPVVQDPVMVFTLEDLMAFYEQEIITIDD